MTALIGGSVNARQSLAQICPAGKTIAGCEIDELYADYQARVSEGQTATTMLNTEEADLQKNWMRMIR